MQKSKFKNTRKGEKVSEKNAQFFGKCSFLTQMLLKGWGDERTPVWGDLINSDENDWPSWVDWTDTRNKFIAPLCRMAESVSLFANEWKSDRREVLDLKNFVQNNFHKKGRYLVCDQPKNLADASLFWTGGRPKYFNLIMVLKFDIQHLAEILEVSRYQHQAVTMSPRYGRESSI